MVSPLYFLPSISDLVDAISVILSLTVFGFPLGTVMLLPIVIGILLRFIRMFGNDGYVDVPSKEVVSNSSYSDKYHWEEYSVKQKRKVTHCTYSGSKLRVSGKCTSCGAPNEPYEYRTVTRERKVYS